MRRRSSSMRSSVRATSMPPHSMRTPSSSYWRMLSSVSAVISREWSTGKMKLDACPVEPPGLGSGPLSSSTRSLQPSRARWPHEAVADDARADHHGASGRRQGSYQPLVSPARWRLALSSCLGVSFLGSTNGISTTTAPTVSSGRSISSSVPSSECSIGTIA